MKIVDILLVMLGLSVLKKSIKNICDFVVKSALIKQKMIDLSKILIGMS